MVAFLRDPFAGLPEEEHGNLIEPLRAASWLFVNLTAALLVVCVPVFVLLGVLHVPVAEWLHGLVSMLYGVGRAAG